jgi:hypothetical protein
MKLLMVHWVRNAPSSRIKGLQNVSGADFFIST